MPGYTQVVLRETLEHLGRSGDVVRVRPGYARNYLLPRGLAVEATRGNLKQVEHEQRLAREREQKLRHEAEGIAAALREVTIQLTKQAGNEGKLYGSVTAQDVASALKDKGYDIGRRKLVMPDTPIKQVGTYEIAAKLAPGVTPTFQVDVQAAE